MHLYTAAIWGLKVHCVDPVAFYTATVGPPLALRTYAALIRNIPESLMHCYTSSIDLFRIGSGATHGLGDATLPSGAPYRFLLSICMLALGSFISICDSYLHLHVGFICVTHSAIRTTEYRLGALA